MHINIQDIRNVLKGRPLGMSQLKWLNLQGQIQNEIGIFALSHLGVGLI
jgi:hypothetical protein